jgi:nucleosome binding factor SPN SPT16 subunit
MAIIFKDF